MTQDSQFWINEYRQKASLEDPVAQTGRGHRFAVKELLYNVREVVVALGIEPQHSVLNVGCANGLMDIVLSGLCKNLCSIEPVEELAAKAAANLRSCTNTKVLVGEALSLPCDEGQFDRVLFFGVIQLVPKADLPGILKEAYRVCAQGAKVLIASIPDETYREAYMKDYLEGVKKAAHLSDEQKDAIIARNMASSWYAPAEIARLWSDYGMMEIVRLSDEDPNNQTRYHALLHVRR